ncbi:MAG: HD domain-containing protein, partial [Nanoarchaeota archaeon]
ELVKMFKHNPCFALYHMPQWLKCYIFEGLDYHQGVFHGHFHAEDIKQHLMITLATAVRLTENWKLRLACFLHDIGKCLEVEYNEWNYPTFPKHDTLGAERVEQWMKTMKFSNDEIYYVTQLIKHHMVNNNLFREDKPQNRAVKRYVMALGEELLDDMILLNYCDRAGNLANTELCSYEEYLQKHTIKPIWLEIKTKETAFKVTDLKVNGHDIMALGFTGKKVGEVLNHLFNQVENDTLQNDRIVLLKELELYRKLI